MVKDKAKSLNFSDDQTIDLATCFVQNIPYDNDKARKVLTEDRSSLSEDDLAEIQDRFPYETLYDNKGICTDKSYLEAALIKSLGYGSSLFTFDDVHHMAVGISVSEEYVDFDSGYGYIETTNTGYKVGQLPVLDSEGEAGESEIIKSTQDFIPEIPDVNFPNPSKIVPISTGKNYDQIIEIRQNEEDLEDVISQLNDQNQELASAKQDLDQEKADVESAQDEVELLESSVRDAQEKYEANPTHANYQDYSVIYARYSASLSDYKSQLDNYREDVDKYNLSINSFNVLIEKYNKLIKSDWN